jgi:hypothetical protein
MTRTHLTFATIATVVIAATIVSAAPLTAREPTMIERSVEAAQVSVEAVVARDVVDRMPVDTGTVFPVDVGNLVLWMRATGADGQVLHHVWFWGDTELGDVPLNVGGSPWRAWSRKVVMPEMTGRWHVEVRDASDKVLKRIDFTVGS